jgi:tetratricopeptide (TPR) repeat protein
MRVLAPSLAFALFTTIAAPALADELEDLQRVAEAHPDDMKACDAYAAAALKQKRYDDAIKRLKVTVARVPDYPEGYYKLAYAYRAKREWADAADYYRRYITLNPARSDTYFGLGAALQGLGDNKGATAAYQKYVAVEKSPQKQRFVDEAWAELSKLSGTSPGANEPPATPAPGSDHAAKPSPSDAAALRAKADELRAQNKWSEAVPAYKRAIAADPGNLELCNDLGNTYFALKQYSDAAQAFAGATQRDPGYALGWYNQAHALRKAERWREAAEAYRQYIKLKPDDPDPYYGLGQTLKALGDTGGAIAAFQKYVGMERRPDEQKWVDKARVELQALEAMQSPPASSTSRPASGKLEDKSTGDDAAAREKLDRELKRDAVLPPSDDDLRLMDPFMRGQLHDLKDPFRAGAGDDIVDPFDHPAAVAMTPSAERLRQYGAALAAYRRALSRHAEEVAQRFDRGVASALATNGASALRAWNSVPLEDSELAAARASVERIRKSMTAPTAAASTTIR